MLNSKMDFKQLFLVTSYSMLIALTSGCALSHKQKPASGVVYSDPPLTHSPKAPVAQVNTDTDSDTHPASNSSNQLLPSAPDQYIVKKGDTLWDISARFLADPWYWPEIWHVNPEIKNPHLIYPGDVISLYYVDGQPRLGINQPIRGGDGKLQPRVRNSALTGENSGIPITTIRPFLIRPRIVSKEQLDAAAHILDSDESKLIFGTNDKVYVRNLENSQVGQRYSVFRPGEKLLDPVTQELLGFEAIYAGNAKVEVDGDPATVRLSKTVREILRGDRLMPMDVGATGLHFWPHAPSIPVNGQIISLFDALTQAAQYQVVAINLGKRDNIEPGHVLAIMQKGRLIKDRYHRDTQSEEVQLPAERTATAMIFRTFEKLSYALIMKSSRTVKLGDLVSLP